MVSGLINILVRICCVAKFGGCDFRCAHHMPHSDFTMERNSLNCMEIFAAPLSVLAVCICAQCKPILIHVKCHMFSFCFCLALILSFILIPLLLYIVLSYDTVHMEYFSQNLCWLFYHYFLLYKIVANEHCAEYALQACQTISGPCCNKR